MKEKLKSCLVLFKVFFKIGLFTFGGGYAMLPIIQKEIIENHKWISEEDMLDIVAIAESTPGPISVNTATFVGYKTAGVLGALFATIGLAIPSLVIIFIISFFYQKFIDNEWVAKAFKGIMGAVTVLILNAGIKLSKPLRKDKNKLFNIIMIIIAITLSLVLVELSSIYLILGGAVIGILYFIVVLPLFKKKEVK
ncbi:MAG: chromate transporter [Bacilli bacterium]|nr:chromate transporter [Bacilli bacterium]